MKVLNKIKSKMCLNKPPVSKGFRVSLKWDLGVKKGICCGSLEELRQKICLKFPECGGRELGLFTHDGTEVWGHLPGYCTCVSFSLHDPSPSCRWMTVSSCSPCQPSPFYSWLLLLSWVMLTLPGLV